MINLDQVIKVKWITKYRFKYEKRGYIFTKYGDYFDIKVKDLDENSHERVSVKCDVCGIELKTPYRNYNKIIKEKGIYRCRECNRSVISQIRIDNNKKRQLKKFETFIRLNGYKSIAKEDDYKGCNVPMKFICNKHGIQELSIFQLQQGRTCPECSKGNRRRPRLDIEKIKSRIFEKNNDILLNPEEYVDIHTRNLKIKCGSCGNIFITNFVSISVSSGFCKDCAIKNNVNKRKLTAHELRKRSTRNGICYIINPEDYINCSEKNLLFYCEECGKEFLKDFGHYFYQNEILCKKCISKIKSYGEYAICKFLDNNNIKYIQQYRFENCRNNKPLPFDFYLQDYNLLIEFDGWMHYHKLENENIESFELKRKRDLIKDDFCKNNNLDLLRIPYWERDNMENILKKKLNIT